MTGLSPEDADFQTRMLLGVSRTFALTIPQLPDRLYEVVANAYLLCRIADTIEDDPGLDAKTSRDFAQRFVEVVAGREDAAAFAQDLSALLTDSSLPAERELVAKTAQATTITRGFSGPQREALADCVAVMSAGMARYQQGASRAGLETSADLDGYCYVVAGVVGECLTRLFLDYLPRPDEEDPGQGDLPQGNAFADHEQAMMDLAVSFGLGLQLTNILKDVWEDDARGVCWLPRDVLAQQGLDLSRHRVSDDPEKTVRAMSPLFAVACAHLECALEYSLLIPAHERGMRLFCLWALGMALLTLRKLARSRDYQAGRRVKIRRWSVRATVVFTRLFAGNDRVLRWAFRRLARPLAGVSGCDQVLPMAVVAAKTGREASVGSDDAAI